MTKYEMLQILISDADFQNKLTSYLQCDKIKLLLNEHDGNEYMLDVDVIDTFDDSDVKMYSEIFDFRLDDRGSVAAFYIKFNDKVTVVSAVESAMLGKIIEEYLKSKLN